MLQHFLETNILLGYYAALFLLGEPRDDLLAEYRWRDEFLRLNPGLT